MASDRMTGFRRWAGLAFLLATTSQAAAFTPGSNTGTGPYRRVYANTGYTYMSASVTLPSATSTLMNDGDTAYVYTGGWGANGSTAVDAGFQYSPTYSDWSLFEDVSGIGDYIPGGLRFKSGQTLTLSFGVSAVSGSSATLQVIANGINVNGTQVQEQVSVPNVPNWAAGSDTLKRMTSIAQSGDNFTDGSKINGVHWYNSTIGTSSSNAVSWLASQTGGYQSYTSSVVSVSYVNAGNETDSINLTGGAAIAAEVAEIPEPAMLPMAALVFSCVMRRNQRGSRPSPVDSVNGYQRLL